MKTSTDSYISVFGIFPSNAARGLWDLIIMRTNETLIPIYKPMSTSKTTTPVNVTIHANFKILLLTLKFYQWEYFYLTASNLLVLYNCGTWSIWRSMFFRATTIIAAKHALGNVLNSGPIARQTIKTKTLAIKEYSFF